ncbi:hypothetical protein Lser_V15G31524 [Lactuca serriola]
MGVEIVCASKQISMVFDDDVSHGGNDMKLIIGGDVGYRNRHDIAFPMPRPEMDEANCRQRQTLSDHVYVTLL